MKENHTDKNTPFINTDNVYRVALKMIIAILLVTLSAFILPATSFRQVFADDDTVSFTVYYQDGNGKTLHEPKVFYGKVGTKPSVDCDDIEGYDPEVSILTKTLNANEDENVFTFVYHENGSDKAAAPEQNNSSDQDETVIEDGGTPLADGSYIEQGGSSSGNGKTDGDTAEKSSSLSGQAGARIGNAKIRDLDEEDPLAEPGKAENSFNSVMIFIIALQILLLAAVVVAIRKHRKAKC